MMKNKENKIKIIKILIIIIIIILACILSLSYTINSNNNYTENLIKKVKNNYKIKDNITYINTYNNYYIFTTKDKVIVLNNKYKEVFKEDLKKLKSQKDDYELIYKSGKLMYEKTIRDNNSITYEYYDINTGKKTSSIKLEK